MSLDEAPDVTHNVSQPSPTGLKTGTVDYNNLTTANLADVSLHRSILTNQGKMYD